MKKRQLDVDFFYLSELEQYLKHFRHGKYPGEKTQRRSEKKSLRQAGKAETQSRYLDAA